MMKEILLAALCCQLLGTVLGDVKTWTKNTNFDDPANWNGGGIVCSNDKKVFPKDLVASIFVQKNESLQELVLSDNMVLSVGEGVVLSFNTEVVDTNKAAPSADELSAFTSVSQETTTAGPSCTPQGRVVQFSAKPSSWYNPESWSTQLTSNNETKRFMLDMESVPCSEDRVVFPPQNSFLVDVEKTAIKAGSVLVHKQELNSQTAFNSYWSGDVSRYEFVNRPTKAPTISGRPCADDTTCQCKDRYSHGMRKLVCNHVTCDDRKVSKCADPVIPTYGHCCKLCGAKLILSTTASETPSLLYELHMQILAGLKQHSQVRYSVGPQVNNAMEIILTDIGGTGVYASAAVCTLRDLLLINETAHTLKISKIEFQRSDGQDNCYASLGTTQAVRAPDTKWDSIIIGGSMAFAVVCVLVVLVGVYFYRKRYTENGKNEMELGNVSNRSSQGFDNPVYNTPLPFEDSFIVQYDSSPDQVNGFENVLYSSSSADSPVTVHKQEKKAPLEDPYAPVVKKPKKKSASSNKKKKDVGFDNPVYAIEDKGGSASMVSVPLDEDDSQLPAYVEHDGTDDNPQDGFANPIATGLSEEMMAPSLPKKEPITTLKANNGFDNPLFDAEQNNGVEELDADLGEVTVHVSEPTKKKKKGKNGKSKEHKSKNGQSSAEKKQGFDNPLYEQTNEPPDFYQPETPGEDKSTLPADED